MSRIRSNESVVEQRNDAACDGAAVALDGRLTAALERRPTVSVSERFAARLMEHLPETLPGRQTRREPSRVGTRVAYLSIVVIALALLGLVGVNPAAFAAGRSFRFVFEMMLVSELLALGFWLGTRREA